MPFAMLPFYSLNVSGRVMDFKKESFWASIIPHKQNVYYVNSTIAAQRDGSLKGEVNYTSSGYVALERRKLIKAMGAEEYVKAKEYTKDHRDIADYRIEGVENIDIPLEEKHSIRVYPDGNGEDILLFPFVNELYFDKNPFTLEERTFPIDLGYPFSNIYTITIDLGDVYTVAEMPQNRIIKLPGDDGLCTINYSQTSSKVEVHFNFRFNEYRFQPEAYASLKEFFEFAVSILKDEVIVLNRL